METLQNVFPSVPASALSRVMEICDYNVETASEWILENNWQDLVDNEAGQTAAVATVEAEIAQRSGEETTNNGDIERIGRLHAVEQSEGEIVVEIGVQQGQEQSITQQQHLQQLPSSIPPQPHITVLSVPAETQRTAENPPMMVVSTEMNFWNSSQSVNGVAARHMDRSRQYNTFRDGRPGLNYDIDHEFDSGGDQDLDSDEGEDEDDEDEEDDEDDEDDEDEDGDSYYDSGDEGFFHSAIPPLTKRVKITQVAQNEKAKDSATEKFWVSFDDQVVPKTLIELLNTALSKLAHSKVTLLNKSSKHISEAEAAIKLRSVLSDINESSRPNTPIHAGRNIVNHILNDPVVSSPITVQHELLASAGQKRKRVEETTPSRSHFGFFAHFFSISDLDMVWRSVMHAHLFNGRFGEIIEFHTAPSGSFNKRDFDELMHLHSNLATTRAASLGVSPFASLKCCLILPCEADEEEIFRVGRHLHSLLKLQGSLYYRTLDESNAITTAPRHRLSQPGFLLNEDGKMTEDSFRCFAKYRIKKEELSDKIDSQSSEKEHFLVYQPQRKVEYCLQSLKTDGWDRRISSYM